MTMLVFKVGNIETGDLYTIRIDIQDFSLAMFKNSLLTFSGVQPNEQILLIGPPFKKLDNQFSMNMQDNDQKIYLYSRRLFTDPTHFPKESKLKPYEIPLTTSPLNPISISLEGHQSPILSVLPNYEKKYLDHIQKGENYLNFSEQVFSSCKRCIEQMEVQIQALLAAIGNLSDHYKATQISYESSKGKLIEQQTAHKLLLDNFEPSLERLKKIPLHPSLYPIATTEEELAQQKEKGLTLLDTLPVEKEIAWINKCTHAHRQVEENMSQLQTMFDKVTASFQSLDSSQVKTYVLRCSEKIQKIESSITQNKLSLSELRESYHNINDKLAMIIDKASTNSVNIDLIEDDCTNLIKILVSGSRKQENEIILPMNELTNEIMRLKDEISHDKNELTKEIFQIMKQVAHLQTDIQFKVRKGMDLMKKWRTGDNGYFQHLEKTQHLPESYRHFLVEILRRKKYTEEFEKLIKDAVANIQAYRDIETKKREEYMNTFGSTLPLLFFDAVPSLNEKPPYFSATVTERQYLPEITIDDVTALTNLGIFQSDDDPIQSMNSSLSSVTINDSESFGGMIQRERTDSMVSVGERDVNFPTLENQNELLVYQRMNELDNENKRLKEQIEYLLKKQTPIEISQLDSTPQISPEINKNSQNNQNNNNQNDNNNNNEENINTPNTKTIENTTTSTTIVTTTTTSTTASDNNQNIFQKSHERMLEIISLLDSLKSLSELRDSDVKQMESDNLLDKKMSGNELEENEINQKIQLLLSTIQTDINNIVLRDVQSNEQKVSSELETELESDTNFKSNNMNENISINSSTRHVEKIPKISFLSFDVGDIALFLLTNKPDVYLAFSHGKCPNRYLSQDSLTQFKTPKSPSPGYILGKIIFIETRKAFNGDKYPGIGPVNNPLRLADGVEYHLIDIEHVSFGSNKQSRRKSESLKSTTNYSKNNNDNDNNNDNNNLENKKIS